MSVLVISPGSSVWTVQVRGSSQSAPGWNTVLTSKKIALGGGKKHWDWITNKQTNKHFLPLNIMVCGSGSRSCYGSFERAAWRWGHLQRWAWLWTKPREWSQSHWVGPTLRFVTTLFTSGLPYASNVFPYRWKRVESRPLQSVDTMSSCPSATCDPSVHPPSLVRNAIVPPYTPAQARTLHYLSILRLTTCRSQDRGWCNYTTFHTARVAPSCSYSFFNDCLAILVLLLFQMNWN